MKPGKWYVVLPNGPGQAKGYYDVCGTKKKPHIKRQRPPDAPKPRVKIDEDAPDAGFTYNPDEAQEDQ